MSNNHNSLDLNSYIGIVPDFPRAGIKYRDITPLLGDAGALRCAIDNLTALCKPLQADVVAGIDARGFLFGMPLAYTLNLPFVPVRKPGKLPRATRYADYELEYDADRLELHVDAVKPGQRVLIVDDLLATGGTMSTAEKLLEQCQGHVVGYAFLIELKGYEGRKRLGQGEVVALLQYK